MLTLPVLSTMDMDAVIRTFHRDGVVVLRDLVSGPRLAEFRTAAFEELEKVVATRASDDGHFGHGHYSFKRHLHHRSWIDFMSHPGVLAVAARIFGSDQFTVSGGAGAFALPRAGRQALHADMRDWLKDPLGQSSSFDLPTPEINVNLLLVDFTEANGATRYIPCTHRTRLVPPPLDEEPDWMKESFVCLPAGTIVIRDLRLWHGGGPNASDAPRVMMGISYRAPWYQLPPRHKEMSYEYYRALPPRAQALIRPLISL
jgi:ectoine hydroxylase-related dioxygenase (phytanoyl-CoA dioxygenase family)